MPKKEIILENLGYGFCIRSESHLILENLYSQCKDYLISSNKKKYHFLINIYYSFSKLPRADEIIIKNSNWFVGKNKRKIFIFYHSPPTLIWIDKNLREPINVFTKDVQAKIVPICLIDWISIASLIEEKKGGCFHACGIADNKMGFIFMGPSGSGKTTIANLRKNRVLIDEDDIILKRLKNKIYIFRQIGYRDKIRFLSPRIALSAIFFLQKSKRNFIKFMPKNLSFINILGNVKTFIPFWKFEIDNMVDFCSDLSKRIPCYTLGFTRSKQFWRLIKKEVINGVVKKDS